jgi:hypothetical protein
MGVFQIREIEHMGISFPPSTSRAACDTVSG